MKTTRRFAYAAALTLSALNFAPSRASAQDAAGTFTLTHKVRWQRAIVPAGKYRFTIASSGASEMLTLSKINGKGAGFMLLVTDAEASQSSGPSQLVVVSRSGESFISTMQIPDLGLTLRFAVPAERREVAQSAPTTTTAPAVR
jgi:hypothetical protein